MSGNEINKDKGLPKELVILRKAEFGRIMAKVNQGSAKEIANTINDTEHFIGHIKDDFENRKEIFIPAPKVEN